MDLEGLIRRVPSEPLAVQLYAASPLAIGMDTDAERQYLRRLARAGLEASVVRVHQCLGEGTRSRTPPREHLGEDRQCAGSLAEGAVTSRTGAA